MAKEKLSCALCASEIDDESVRETIDGEEKVFCCDGCARVYREAAAKGILDQVVIKDQHDKKKVKHHH
ncbi:MAG: Archaeal domain [Chloroflexota bacterium]|nr:Archaeal domain [Chloroflexota bacterium]